MRKCWMLSSLMQKKISRCFLPAQFFREQQRPVTLAGAIAMSSAEVLAGIVLAELVHPGVPVIFEMQLDPRICTM